MGFSTCLDRPAPIETSHRPVTVAHFNRRIGPFNARTIGSRRRHGRSTHRVTPLDEALRRDRDLAPDYRGRYGREIGQAAESVADRCG
jgi:hypothetical protein